MKRIQLTLFAAGPAASELERVRRTVDSAQSGLIRAHVTLCREGEMDGISASDVAERAAGQPVLSLAFGRARRFGGHGILLQCTGDAAGYARLRGAILGPGAPEASPHLTLAHPRNPRAAGNALEAVDLSLPVDLLFDRLSLIEQEAAGTAWRVLQEFPLGR